MVDTFDAYGVCVDSYQIILSCCCTISPSRKNLLSTDFCYGILRVTSASVEAKLHFSL